MKAITKKADLLIIFITITLITLGFAILASASSNIGETKFNDAYFFVKQQFVFGFGIGILAFLGGLFIPIKYFKKCALPLLLINILGLILVFTPIGADFGTANRWLDIAGVQFQPSVILQFVFILYVATWLASKKKDRSRNALEGLIPFMIICIIISLLLIIQPSTTILIIIMSSALIIYFLAGIKVSLILWLSTITLLLIIAAILISPYRFNRIAVRFNPNVDIRGDALHVNQAKNAVGSGGLTGVGYGNSTLKKSLPEPFGDSIFAVIAEEFGFIGSMFFIFLYFLFVLSGFLGANKTRTDFGRLIVIGFSSIIGIQAFLHMGASSTLLPMTGIPLPFISYGGTSLIVFMAMVGLIINALRNA